MLNKVQVKLDPLGIDIRVVKDSPLKDAIHEYGIEFPCGGKGSCMACKVKLQKGNIALTKSHENALAKKGLNKKWRLACMSKVSEDITLEISQFNSIILADNTKFSFNSQSGFGIAIDIGTTTLVAQLINMKNGAVADVKTALNPQAKFGADIMSRINHALTPKGLEELQVCIREKLKTQIFSLIANNDLEINKVVLVGNTVMHHLFYGLDVSTLSVYPFKANSTQIINIKASQLDWPLPDETEIQFLPNIGSFVGSDILAGLIAINASETIKPFVLVDLGTNGEIAVGNQDKILVASTAAGPAFEGTNISMGMKAATGAISSVDIKDDLCFHVIGNTKAKGICGSGLIDAVACLRKQEKIDLGGQIVNNKEALPLTNDVKLNQQDIREFQLAKAAIAAGIHLLLNKLNLNHGDIENVYIAGGFGNFITIENIINLELLEFEKSKIKKRGNTALIGAKMSLFNNNDTAQRILKKCTHVSLEAEPDFQDIYIEKMML